MSQRRIQPTRLGGNLPAFLVGTTVLDLAHQIDASGDDDEDDANVLGKRKHEVAEGFCFHTGIAVIQFTHTRYTFYNMSHVGTKFTRSHFLTALFFAAYTLHKNGKDTGTVQSNLLGADECRLQVKENGVESEGTTQLPTLLHRLVQQRFCFFKIFCRKRISREYFQTLKSINYLLFFFHFTAKLKKYCTYCCKKTKKIVNLAWQKVLCSEKYKNYLFFHSLHRTFVRRNVLFVHC